MGYDTIALDHSVTGKVPADIRNEIPNPLPFQLPNKLKVIRRCTLHLSDPSQNHRLSQLSPTYDLFALRPTTEKAFQQACMSLECDIVSIDCSQRHPFYFHIKTVKTALLRGIKFEICYGPGVLNADGGASRRNLISNATQLIRASRGRGLIISSEARRALGCRSPSDVVNLAVLWGLNQERAHEAVGREAHGAVMQAHVKRNSFRGAVEIIDGGEPPDKPSKGKDASMQTGKDGKRKADCLDEVDNEAEIDAKPLSKRAKKKLAKQARKEAREKEQQEQPGATAVPDKEVPDHSNSQVAEAVQTYG